MVTVMAQFRYCDIGAFRVYRCRVICRLTSKVSLRIDRQVTAPSQQRDKITTDSSAIKSDGLRTNARVAIWELLIGILLV